MPKMLKIINLHVSIEGKEIIKGVSLTFHSGKVHALMGPNGSGKSTLAQTLMGNPKFKITQGKIILDGKDLTKAKPQERAKAGLFLSFQHPVEVPGVNIGSFLRTAVQQVKGKKYSVLEFHQLLQKKMALLKIDSSFSQRHLNEGFSGGEKKKNEILQMLLMQPKYALLDETDSGLDVDAIKTVASGIKQAIKEQKMGVVLITHYRRFLEYLKPDEVSVIYQGRIVAKGKAELARKIEKEGFEGIVGK